MLNGKDIIDTETNQKYMCDRNLVMNELLMYDINYDLINKICYDLPVEFIDKKDKYANCIIIYACNKDAHDTIDIICNKGGFVMYESFINYIIRNDDVDKIKYVVEQSNLIPKRDFYRLINIIYATASTDPTKNYLVENLIDNNILLNLKDVSGKCDEILKACIYQNNYDFFVMNFDILLKDMSRYTKSKMLECVIENDNANMLKYLFDNGVIIDDLISTDIYYFAKSCNSNNVIKYLSANNYVSVKEKMYYHAQQCCIGCLICPLLLCLS